jgi:hypothetical protein
VDAFLKRAVIAVWLVVVAFRARNARRSGAASIVGAEQLQTL